MPRAERDINAIVAWLTRRSPIGARNWLVALERALDSMGTQPEAMGLALESSCVKSDLKQCLFKTAKGRTYRAVFLMENNAIVVLRVRGQGQPPLADDEL